MACVTTKLGRGPGPTRRAPSNRRSGAAHLIPASRASAPRTAGGRSATAEPLRLWIGGDSRADRFGSALGTQTGGATGSFDATIDYKVERARRPGHSQLDEHAAASDGANDPDHVVFIIGANDASIVNSSTRTTTACTTG